MDYCLAPTTPKKVAQRRNVSSASLVRPAATPPVDHEGRRLHAARSLLSSELISSHSSGALPTATTVTGSLLAGNRSFRGMSSTQPAPRRRTSPAPRTRGSRTHAPPPLARKDAFEASVDQYGDGSSDSSSQGDALPTTQRPEGKAQSHRVAVKPPSDLSQLQLPSDLPGLHVTMESLAAASRQRAQAISAELGGILRNVSKATEKFAQPPVMEMHDAEEWSDAVSRMDDSARRAVAGLNEGVLLPRTPTRASTREATSAQDEATGMAVSLDSQGVAFKGSFQGQPLLDSAGSPQSLQLPGSVSGKRRAAVTPALLATQLLQVDEALNESHERHLEQRKGLREVARRVATMQRRQKREAKQRRRTAKEAQKLEQAVQSRGLRDAVMAGSPMARSGSPRHMSLGGQQGGGGGFRPFSPGEPGNAFEAPDVLHEPGVGGVSRPALSPSHTASPQEDDMDLLSPLLDDPAAATAGSDSQQRLSHRLRSFEALLGMQARRQRKLRSQVQQERDLAQQGGTHLRVWHRRHLLREARRQKRLLAANGASLASGASLTAGAASDDEKGRVAHNWFGKVRAKHAAASLTMSPWGSQGGAGGPIWVEEADARARVEGLGEGSTSSDSDRSSGSGGSSVSADSELETEIRLQAVTAEVQQSQSAVQATAAAAGASSSNARVLFSKLHDAIDKRLGKQHAATLQAALHEAKVSLSQERTAHRTTAVRLAALQDEREAMRSAQAEAAVAREHADRDVFAIKRENNELQERLDSALKELVEARTALGAAQATETIFKHRHAKADRTKAELLQELQSLSVRTSVAEAALDQAKTAATEHSAAAKQALEQAAAASHEAQLTTTEMNIHKLTLDLRTDEMRRRIKSLSRVLRQRYSGLKQLLHSTVQRVLGRTPLATRGPAVLERMFTVQDAESALQTLQSIKDAAQQLGASPWEDSSDDEGGAGGSRPKPRDGTSYARVRSNTFAIASVSGMTGDMSFAQARVQRDKWVLGLLEAYRDKTKELTRLIHDEKRETYDMASERDAAKAQVSLLKDRVEQLSASAMASLSKAERVAALKSDPEEIRARVAAQRSVATIREQLSEAQQALAKARQDRLWADAQAQGDYLRAMTQAEEAQTKAAEASEALQLLSTEAAEVKTILEGLREQNTDLSKRHTVAEARLVSLARRCASVGIDIGLLAEQYGLQPRELQSAAEMRQSLKNKTALDSRAALAFSLASHGGGGATTSISQAATPQGAGVDRIEQGAASPTAARSPATSTKRKKAKRNKRGTKNTKAGASTQPPPGAPLRPPPPSQQQLVVQPTGHEEQAASTQGAAAHGRASSSGGCAIGPRSAVQRDSELEALAFLPAPEEVPQQSHFVSALDNSDDSSDGGGNTAEVDAALPSADTTAAEAAGDADAGPLPSAKARKRRPRAASSPKHSAQKLPAGGRGVELQESSVTSAPGVNGQDVVEQQRGTEEQQATSKAAAAHLPPRVADSSVPEVVELSTTAESVSTRRRGRKDSTGSRNTRGRTPVHRAIQPSPKHITASTQTVELSEPLQPAGTGGHADKATGSVAGAASQAGNASARSMPPQAAASAQVVRAVSPPNPERDDTEVPGASGLSQSPGRQERGRLQKASELAGIAVRRTVSESSAVGVDTRLHTAHIQEQWLVAGSQQAALAGAQAAAAQHALRESLADCRLENARLRSAVWELEEHIEQTEEVLAACGVQQGPIGHSGTVARRWRLPSQHTPAGATSTLRSDADRGRPSAGLQRTRTVSHSRRGLAGSSADDSTRRSSRAPVRSVGTSTSGEWPMHGAAVVHRQSDAAGLTESPLLDRDEELVEPTWGDTFDQDDDDGTHVHALLHVGTSPAPVLGWNDSEDSSGAWNSGDGGSSGASGADGFATPTGSTGKHVWFAAAGSHSRLGPVPEGASVEEQQRHLLAQVAHDASAVGPMQSSPQGPSRPSSTPVPRDLLAQRRALAIRVKQLEGRLEHMARRMQQEHDGRVAALDALKLLQRRLHAYERALESGAPTHSLLLLTPEASQRVLASPGSPHSDYVASSTATDDRQQSFQTPVFRASTRRTGSAVVPPSTGHPVEASLISPDMYSIYQDVGSVRSNLRSPLAQQSSLNTASGPSRAPYSDKLPPLGRIGTADGADPSAVASGRDTHQHVAAQLFRGGSAAYSSSSRSGVSENRDGTLTLHGDKTFESAREHSVPLMRPTSSGSTSEQIESVRAGGGVQIHPSSAAHAATRGILQQVAGQQMRHAAAAVATAHTNRSLATLHASWLPSIRACVADLHCAQLDSRYLNSMLMSGSAARQLPVHPSSIIPLAGETQARLVHQVRSGNLLLPSSSTGSAVAELNRQSAPAALARHMQYVYISPMLRLQLLLRCVQTAVSQGAAVPAASVQELTLNLPHLAQALSGPHVSGSDHRGANIRGSLASPGGLRSRGSPVHFTPSAAGSTPMPLGAGDTLSGAGKRLGAGMPAGSDRALHMNSTGQLRYSVGELALSSTPLSALGAAKPSSLNHGALGEAGDETPLRPQTRPFMQSRPVLEASAAHLGINTRRSGDVDAGRRPARTRGAGDALPPVKTDQAGSSLHAQTLPRIDGRGLRSGLIIVHGSHQTDIEEELDETVEPDYDVDNQLEDSSPPAAKPAPAGEEAVSATTFSTRHAIQSLLAIGSGASEADTGGVLPDEFASFAGFH